MLYKLLTYFPVLTYVKLIVSCTRRNRPRDGRVFLARPSLCLLILHGLITRKQNGIKPTFLRTFASTGVTAVTILSSHAVQFYGYGCAV